MNPANGYKKEAHHSLPAGIIFPLISQWQCPSNIAVVKYWGKKEGQLPRNPSISFSLEKSYTQFRISCTPCRNSEQDIRFFFEGQSNEMFEKKIREFIHEITLYFPFLKNLDISIESTNTFPHSSGIASSASAFGALALALTDMERKIFNVENGFLKKASFVAREGSGSACRSVFGGWNIWGESPVVPGSSDFFATNLDDAVHDVFKNYQDTILIVSSDKKEVSSSKGHELMNSHSFADERYLQAKKNTESMIKILKGGDLHSFIIVAENEALTLHAMMMTGNPSYLLMKPYTLAIMNRIREYRRETDIPLCFTLDAGPNVHVLYPFVYREKVREFIEKELSVFCEQQKYIYDQTGNGPVTF